MMELLADPQIWMALLTLTALEIVLGVDNVIFISILAAKLPVHEQEKGRKVGLLMALVMRLLLLFSISWIVQLTEPLFSVFEHPVSGRDFILLIGGLFLIGKSTHEIHDYYIKINITSIHYDTTEFPGLQQIVRTYSNDITDFEKDFPDLSIRDSGFSYAYILCLKNIDLE